FRLTRWSWQIHGGLQGSAATREHPPGRPDTFTYRTITVYGAAFQQLRLATGFLTARPVSSPIHGRPTTPNTQPLPGITRARFSLDPLSLATTHGITYLFSLPAGTEMFHFPAFPPHTLCVQQRVTAHDDCRVSPFGHPRITARLTAPRGLSRPPTSFIGSWCQGIHRAPLKTWPQMLASTVQFSSNDQSPTSTSMGPASPKQ